MKAWAKRASSAASVMSQAKASEAPAPAAVPCAAQTTGFGRARMARTSRFHPRSSTAPRSASGPVSPGSAKSCPAQKARPAPESSTARQAGSRPASSKAPSSAACIAASKAFSFCGRLRVSTR
jgi:hypothetical protein